MKKAAAAAAALLSAMAMFTVSCGREGYIGGITSGSPVEAVIFENGVDNGEPYSGIVYRRVNDAKQLIAKEKVPVLFAFLDDSPYSGNAIPFVETLADTYQGRLTVVRVNVDFSDNPEEVTMLIGLFGVTEYPWFATADRGSKAYAVSGFTSGSEDRIIAMIGRTLG